MITSTIRIIILTGLFVAGMYCLLSTPMDDSTRWFTEFFISKALGVISMVAFALLFSKWSKTDRWIAKYNEFCMRGTE